jgi:hypothetical protein
MEIDHVKIYGFSSAIKGMRNAHNSWDKMDSWDNFIKYGDRGKLGPKDLKLASSLVKMGDEHAKFARQIMIWFDITLPLYMWTEFDTYRLGVVRNSCSTMHSLMKKPLTKKDFEDEEVLDSTLKYLNKLREDKNNLVKMKSHLPSSYLLKSTICTNYQVLRRIYFQRKNHKLPQWKVICKWIETLPHAKELIIVENNDKKILNRPLPPSGAPTMSY